jgi:acyl-coenzyme A synthetase/AMP-(fatty) acid ligase
MKSKPKLGHHSQRQAWKLRQLAEKCDQQMIKLAHRKKSLIALAEKLEAKSEMPKGESGKVSRIGFR